MGYKIALIGVRMPSSYSTHQQPLVLCTAPCVCSMGSGRRAREHCMHMHHAHVHAHALAQSTENYQPGTCAQLAAPVSSEPCRSIADNAMPLRGEETTGTQTWGHAPIAWCRPSWSASTFWAMSCAARGIAGVPAAGVARRLRIQREHHLHCVQHHLPWPRAGVRVRASSSSSTTKAGIFTSCSSQLRHVKCSSVMWTG